MMSARAELLRQGRTGRPNPATYDAAAQFLRARPAALVRLLSRTKRSTTGCLIWIGSKNKKGYACAAVGGHHVVVHRLIYALHHGDPGADFDTDHRCSVRGCIAIEHLRPLTHVANVRAGRAKKTHCHRGHRLDGDNLRATKAGTRCAACIRIDTDARCAAGRALTASRLRPPTQHKAFCCRGHELTEQNRQPTRAGSRCRECVRARYSALASQSEAAS